MALYVSTGNSSGVIQPLFTTSGDIAHCREAPSAVPASSEAGWLGTKALATVTGLELFGHAIK
ncbi:hypothetical protein ACFQ71_40870 [Streptomyces sp. NPDC056534]|uniref:hypothetical protein n=1 Tax=Streptomyces sp. NPDC056534 TaxID=3345857 RepID=UPI0036753AE6